MSDVDNSASTETSSFLIWEESDGQSWWMARSHDTDAVYVIASDSITGHVLVLRQLSKGTDFKVIAAVLMSTQSDISVRVAEAKRSAVKWLGNPNEPTIRASVRRWRAKRWSKIAMREVPLALAALLTGALLAFIVAAFFVVTSVAGWVMVVVGTLTGGAAGWLMKWLADRKLKSLLGPLGRFLTLAGGATLGALVTTSIFFVLFGA